MTGREPRTLPVTRQHRAAVICNPVKINTARLRAAVDKATAEAGWQPASWFETTPDDPGQAVTAAAMALAPTVLIVAGGDGTVRAVVEQLAGSDLPVAIVAAGTGNLLARNLGLPVSDLEASVRAAFTENARRIDVAQARLKREDGTVDAHAFLVMAGLGLDARMASGTNARLKKHLGWLAYSDPITRSIMSGRRFTLHYALDGGPRRSTRAHTVIVGNCGTLTANILLIPGARPDDGVLDTVAFRPQGIRGWIQIGIRLTFARFLHRTRAGRLVQRGLPEGRALRFEQARRLDVRFNEPQEVELDGDGFGTITAASITVMPRALTLRTPPHQLPRRA